MPTQLDDRLRSLLDQLPLPEDAVADRVAARVATAVRAASRPAAPARNGGRWRRRLVAASALAVAVAGAMLANPFSGGGARIDPAAAAALHRAAITAAHQPALRPLRPGRFYHFRDTEIGWVERTTVPRNVTACMTACPPPPSDWVVKARVTSESWIGAGGGGLRVERVGRPTFRSAAVKRTYRHMYGFPVSRPFGLPSRTHFPQAQHSFGWGLSYRQLQQLPSDPEKLLKIVRRQAAPSSQAVDPSSANSLAFEEFVVVGDIMRASPLRPRVRAAFYTILSRLPGIEFVGHVTDPLGRPGIEVSMTRSSSEPPQILIFDPRNAQLLSEGDGGYSGWSIVDSIGGGR